MPVFRFILTVVGADVSTDDAHRSLFEAGCSEATIARVDCVQLIDFDREAACFADAVGSAIRAVESAVPGLRVVEVRREELTESSPGTDVLTSSDVVAFAGILAEQDYPHWRDQESVQQWVRAVRRGGLPEQEPT